RDLDTNTRLEAAKALWRMERDPQEVLPALLPNLRDEGKVQHAALRLLAEMGPSATEAAAALRELLQETDPLDRFEAARALWAIERHKSSVVPVVAGVLSQGIGPLGESGP